jgi:hypothetical protein
MNLTFALSCAPDESVLPANPHDEILWHALHPRIVMLVERELSANTAPLAATGQADSEAPWGIRGKMGERGEGVPNL